MSAVRPKDDLSRAISLLEARGQEIPQTSVDRARASGKGLTALFPNSSYTELPVTQANAHVVVPYLTDAANRGAAIALEVREHIEGLQQASLWPLYLGVNNAMELRIGGAHPTPGESRWARVRPLDDDLIANLVDRRATFMVLRPDQPSAPLTPREFPDHEQRCGGPVYGAPRTIRPLMMSFSAITEDEVLDKLAKEELGLLSIIHWFNGIDNMSPEFHAQAGAILRTRAPNLVGAAVRNGLQMPPEERFAAAREVVETDPGFLAIHIRDFVIRDPKDRITLAKRIVTLTGSKFLNEVWRRFDITDAHAGAEIDTIAAAFDRIQVNLGNHGS